MHDGQAVSRNRLLRTLPAAELGRMEADLHLIRWDVSETIYHANVPLQHVYFPMNAVCSNIILMENGAGVETSTVGCEGLVGAHAALGEVRIPTTSICQIAGDVACLRLEDFYRYYETLPAFRELAKRFNVLLLNMISQTAACNRLHHVNERLARWLLITHDRVYSDSFSLTHDFLAMMLGVNRPTVSIACRALKDVGLIDYRRGMITIKDRPGLEKASCECYEIVTREVERLLPNGVVRHPQEVAG